MLAELYRSVNESYGRASLLALPMLGMFVALLWNQLDRSGLVLWVAIATCWALFHGGLSLFHRRPGSIDAQVRFRCVTLAASGIAWGTLPILALPAGQQLEAQTTVALVMAALITANTIYAAQLRRVFLAYQLPLGLTATAGFVLEGNQFGRLVALFMLFCVVATIVIHDQANRLVFSVVHVSHDNAALAADLEHERTRLAVTNRELTAVNQELEHRSVHDPLTGLANRAVFTQRLEAALSKHGGVGVAVLFVDVDRFKAINDTHGHRFGDELLQRASQAISSCLRAGDLASRFGGDEFTVLLPESRNMIHALAVGNRIRSAVNDISIPEKPRVKVAVSVGIAVAIEGTDSPASLIRSADIALYRAKQNGRNRVEVFEHAASARPVYGDNESDDEVKAAFDRREIRGWFQPEVDLETGEILGAESLARWEHPDGVRSAGAFMHAVERHGLLDELTTVVSRSIVRANRMFPVRPGFRTHLNISAKFLQNPHRIEAFVDETVRAGLDLTRLAFEVTETAVIEDLPAAAKWLQVARDAGIAIYLDDFGMGYCSLGVFAQLPIDGLKIDLSFVRQLTSSATSRAIVRATAQLAEELGLTVIAEGVETEEQAQALRDLGVYRAQGFLFAGAVPAEEFAEWMRNGAPWQRNRAAISKVEAATPTGPNLAASL